MHREILEGKTVLVTGGAGFIGSHLVDSLFESKVKQVIVIDNMFLGNVENLNSDIPRDLVIYRDDAEFAETIDYIFEQHPIDVVFNCATKALNYSFVNPKNSFDTNVKVVLNLLEKQRKGCFKTLCHFSTSEVYGTAVYEPMDESHPKNPTTLYAAGKAAADLALESYVRMFDLDAFIVRPFNNYGPRQNYKGYMAGVVPITAMKIFNGQVPEIHGSGKQSRDFIFVKDTVNAVLKLYSVMPAGESVNISTDGQITIEKLINDICHLMNYQGEIVRKQERGSDVFCHNASNQKVKSLIDYHITPFNVGLKKTIDWYIKKFEGEKCKD